MKSHFGNVSRKFRKEVRWSQGRFAKAIGVSQGLVSLWELGFAEPSSEKLAEIERVMKVVRDAEHAAERARQNVLNTLR